MEQITVPQFLDVEDKVIGPITVRQFIELLVAGLIIVIFYKVFDFATFAVSGLIVLGMVLILAFFRPNGQGFHYFILNFLVTLKRPKLKVWKKQFTDAELKLFIAKPEAKALPSTTVRPPVTASRLSELSLIVDTGGVYRGENGI
ncbi:MAG: PrgI family protein [Patescibacteria group bacterium]